MNTTEIVNRLWNLCHILRDDGVNYHEYVTELTFLLFLKMSQETGRDKELPSGHRWSDLKKRDGIDQLDFYKKQLVHLGTHGSQRVQMIFSDAQTSLRQPRHLAKLVTDIDELDWYSARHEGLGDMYEGLLEKNATETKSGAGQYFTPRPLIDCMVAMVQPQPGEVVQDPAVGTGGFLIAADRYIKGQTDDLFALREAQQRFQREKAFVGMELVPDVQRLALMNLMLHGIEGNIELADTLSPAGADLPKSDVILTNPPFGTKKGGGRPTRDDFTFPTSNKQLAFLEHVYRGLQPGGRAAVVVPDNVLFEENMGRQIRADLMDKCNLHTVLRLPTGIFYAQGVKTNVLFFSRGTKDKGNTKNIWIYDMRTNMPQFGKRTPLAREHFGPFEKVFGKKADGTSKRKDAGGEGRFRVFARDSVAKRDDNLDIAWLRDEDGEGREALGSPEEIAAEIMQNLAAAMEEMEDLHAELSVAPTDIEAAS